MHVFSREEGRKTGVPWSANDFGHGLGSGVLRPGGTLPTPRVPPPLGGRRSENLFGGQCWDQIPGGGPTRHLGVPRGGGGGTHPIPPFPSRGPTFKRKPFPLAIFLALRLALLRRYISFSTTPFSRLCVFFWGKKAETLQAIRGPNLWNEHCI